MKMNRIESDITRAAILTCFLLLIQGKGYTQSNSEVPGLPGLQYVIDSAIHNSPLLHAKSEEICQLVEEMKIQRESWTDYFYLEGRTRYGLYNQVSINEGGSDQSELYGFRSENEQLNYYAGIGLKLPLSAIFNQNNNIHIKTSQIRQAELEQELLVRELTQLIIEEYYELKTCEESITALLEAFQTLDMGYLKASNDFEIGLISLDEFSLLVSVRNKAKISYINSRNAYYRQYHILQVITGIPLTNLPIQ